MLVFGLSIQSTKRLKGAKWRRHPGSPPRLINIISVHQTNCWLKYRAQRKHVFVLNWGVAPSSITTLSFNTVVSKNATLCLRSANGGSLMHDLNRFCSYLGRETNIAVWTKPASVRRFGRQMQFPGRKSGIPITFGPICTAFGPYFALSFSIVLHVNLVYTIRKEI